MYLEKLKCNLQHVLPHHFLSRLISKLADCEIPFVKNGLIKLFIANYKIDLSTVVSSELKDYPTFNHFFTRALRPDARPIVSETTAIASPADGVISQAGVIEDGELFQAKGSFFKLSNLLAGDAALAANFLDGQFVTIYLAPRDYHRVHMPIDGKLINTIYVPGKLFSVNNASVAHVPNLFCRNERLICRFETSVGEVVLILVGAMLVAGIETVWGQRETPCDSKEVVVKQYQDKGIVLKKGDELGRFQFGSTVILLFPPSSAKLLPFAAQQHINMGALLGHVRVEGK
ncbi:MAG: phosphatidylserine decarboxylase [Gammaproteobacteria bacterium]|nr:phosphatidylserine decarboxylase [Gammaproteobacteria bacterium]